MKRGLKNFSPEAGKNANAEISSRDEKTLPVTWLVEELKNKAEALLEIASGALATSGDARRFLLKDGVRYSHILDPRSGWPVEDPPRSVTVAAGTCLEAGMMATLAMLQGREAEAFLEREKVRAWCIR